MQQIAIKEGCLVVFFLIIHHSTLQSVTEH